MALALVNGRVLTEGGFAEGMAVLLEGGRIVEELSPLEATEERIMYAAVH